MEIDEDSIRKHAKEGSKERDNGFAVQDKIAKGMREDRNLSSPCETQVTLEGQDASSSQGVPSAENNGMDIDSESTYSCLNASSEKTTVECQGEHEVTSKNGSSIDDSGLNEDGEHEYESLKTYTSDHPGEDFDDNNKDHILDISSVDQLGVDIDNKHAQNPEPQLVASSGSLQARQDEDYEYVVPKLGVEFESEDHAYKCYNRYALLHGFSIRKDFVNKSRVTGAVLSRRYTCHRQGYGSTKRDGNVIKLRKETRTGCLAHMTITRQPNGNYRVIHFEDNHNHEFATPLTAHLLPSQKRISFAEAVQSETASKAVDGVPKLGMGFDSEDEAYEFYNYYAARVGFSVRKDYVNRSKRDGAVASRRYTCFREGFRQKDKRGSKVKRPRKETRVGCMAQLVISRQADGKYRVTHFEENHNHELVPARMLRSQKRSATTQASESSSFDATEMQAQSIAELLLTGDGVQSSLSYDPIDHGNRLPSRRLRYLSQEEAESIHHYFRSKQLRDKSFFYAIQLDAEEQMTNFFWADQKMLTDYADFSDAVCFDSTYQLDKDRRPLASFFGVNNHKQLVIFGAAFMYDDTVESFKWLFRTLIKAMSGKKPKTVLSDQNEVVSEAIISEFPETDHRFCAWHVFQSALRHLSQVIVASDSLVGDLSSCIFNQGEEEDFVNSWKVMLDNYSLWENEWLHEKFEERHRWALPYGKHIFSADVETTLLHEDSISSLKKYLRYESHVLQFFKHFCRVVNDWRYKELEANYDMNQQMPRLMGDVIMLKQARDIYTPKIFELFQQEYENYLNIVINQCIEGASTLEYKVSTYGQFQPYTVLYSLGQDSMMCSCMKFQFVGVLCCHALKVLDYRNLKIVPSQYILKRWTRDARA